jgi:hypothetical protein
MKLMFVSEPYAWHQKVLVGVMYEEYRNIPSRRGIAVSPHLALDQ